MGNSNRDKLVITYLPPSSLRPDPRNPRKHSKRHINQLAKSIEAFGFIVPALVEGERQLVTGHGRVEAAKQLGLVETPTISVDHLTFEQRQAYMITGNRLTDLSSWNSQYP